MGSELRIDNVFIQVRDKLQKDGVKLWLEPYYISSGSSVDDLERLAEDYSKSLNLPRESCYAAISELQTHALEKLKQRNRFKESGIATLKIKILNQDVPPKLITKEVSLSLSGSDLKQIVAHYMETSQDRLKLIVSGKLIHETESLHSQGVQNGQQVLAVVLNESVTELREAESRIQEIESVKADTQLLASDEDHYMELEDQAGNPIRMPPNERKSLMVAMALHEKGRSALKKTDYPRALIFFLDADKEFSQCNAGVLNMVDNYALLDLDIAWCYLCLQSVNHLPEAFSRLKRCEKMFEKSYGPNLERVIALKGTPGMVKTDVKNNKKKKYGLRQRKAVNYKPEFEPKDESAPEFSSGSSDNYIYESEHSNLDSETDSFSNAVKNYKLNSQVESKVDTSEPDKTTLVCNNIIPNAEETLSVCSDSVEPLLCQEYLIPFNNKICVTDSISTNAKEINEKFEHDAHFTNRMCNVGFKIINQVTNTSTDDTGKDLVETSAENVAGNKATDQILMTEKNTSSEVEPNRDRVLVNFGNIVETNSDRITVEHTAGVRPWLKTSYCPYCYREVTHFARHLERQHKDEGAVRELLAQPSKRKVLLSALRKQGNYLYGERQNLVRPVRRPKENLDRIAEDRKEDYVACSDCFGYFKRNYLRRHRKRCAMRSEKNNGRENHLSESQSRITCSGNYSKFYNNLRLKKEVFTIMRADEISKMAMSDILICSYAEELLGKHKRTQMRTVISNKMRELGRLLIQLKKTTAVKRMIDVLKPEFFDAIVAATKIISGYDATSRTYKAGSLALHMGTTLRQICDTATKNIIKKCPFIQCPQPEIVLKDIKRLRSLVVNHWNSEVSSLALKNLNEQRWEKPKMFPLTSDLIQFQDYVLSQAKEANENIKKEIDLRKEYRRLAENVLALTVLLNRKRIGEVQYLTLKAYNSNTEDTQQEEFLESLTESEKILTRSFKRVVTGGKGSKPVAILFPKSFQKYIEVLLNKREKCVPETNGYLFANPNTENRWLSGYHTIKKLAEQSGVKNKDLFTSTRLRKQIATVLQVMNITDNEMEQLASFMGHTKKTHEDYYRLPQDLYQTAKVSKLLLAINKGKGGMYKGKSLEEIEFSDNVDSDSDPNLSSNLTGNNNKKKRTGGETADIPIASTSSEIFNNLQKGTEIENETVDSAIASTSTQIANKRKKKKTSSARKRPNNLNSDSDSESSSSDSVKSVGNEAALFLRLHLLQGIVLFHQNKRPEALALFKTVERELRQLKVDEDGVMALVELGYSTAEARLGLRATHGDINQAANYINENREKRAESRRKAMAEEILMREQRKLGKCVDGTQFVNPTFVKMLVNMGYNKEAARCALQKSNNIISDSIQYIQENPGPSGTRSQEIISLINDLIPELQAAGFDHEMARAALTKHNGDIMKAAEELLGNNGVIDAENSLNMEDFAAEDDNVDPNLNNNEDKAKKEEAFQRLAQDITMVDDDHLDLTLQQEEEFLQQYMSLLHED